MAKFKKNDFVKVKPCAFVDSWTLGGRHLNQWVIDHIRTSADKKQPTLYVVKLINSDPSNPSPYMYSFTEEELELLWPDNP